MKKNQILALVNLFLLLGLLGACSNSNPLNPQNAPPLGDPRRTVQDLPHLFRPPDVPPTAATRRTQLEIVLDMVHAAGDSSFDAWIMDVENGGQVLVLKSPAFTEQAVKSLEATSLKATLRAQGYKGVEFTQGYRTARFVWVLGGPRRTR